MLLPALYHWSPAKRYEGINSLGLVAGSKETVASGALQTVCLGTDPQAAWSLSGAMDWCCEVDEWDLWQVRLADTDEVSLRAEFGPHIWEVKVRNSLPRDRLWFVGRRGFSGGELGPAVVTFPPAHAVAAAATGRRRARMAAAPR